MSSGHNPPPPYTLILPFREGVGGGGGGGGDIGVSAGIESSEPSQLMERNPSVASTTSTSATTTTTTSTSATTTRTTTTAAITQTTTTTTAGPTPQYLRSRTGCWTCRFRKKKCDEVKPVCNQCATLRIQCDMASEKQPLYMRDDRAAQQKKADIKAQMGKRRRRRRKKTEERRSAAASSSASAAASAAAVAESSSQGEGDIWRPSQPFDTPQDMDVSSYGLWEREDSFEFDEEVRRFGPVDEPLNSEPGTARPSYIMNRGHPLSVVNSGNALNWGAPQTAGDGAETSSTQALSAVPYISEGQFHQMPSRELDAFFTVHIPFENAVEVNLLKHYIYDVCTYTYRGISEKNLSHLINTVLVPRCQINKSFLYSCISGGLGHLRNIAVARYDSGEAKRLEMTITQYKVRIFQTLQQQVAADAPKDQLLATMLGLLNHEINSALGDWEMHLKPAVKCIQDLGYLDNPVQTVSSHFQTARVVSLDIMAACTSGVPPLLWQTYHKFLSKRPGERSKLRLRDVTGCADDVMFLVSAAICLEYRTKSGELSDQERDRWIRKIDRQLLECYPVRYLPTVAGWREDRDDTMSDHSSPSSASSAPSSPEALEFFGPEPPDFPPPELKQKQCFAIAAPASNLPHEAITAAFVLTTRIHIWSLKLGFHPHHDFFRSLVNELISVTSTIPSGIMGCDRLIVWPLLVGGSLAETYDDRTFFVNRVPHLEPYGVLTAAEKILREVWKVRDSLDMRFGKGVHEVHWRDTMKRMKFEVLMI